MRGSIGAICLGVLALLVLAATPASAKPTCLGKTATIVGSPGDETLRGTSHADVIFAKGGDDNVKAKGGRDRICGLAGDDVLRGGDDKDRFDGGEGIDECDAKGAERADGCEPRLVALTLDPASVTAGDGSVLEAVLDGPAPDGGLVVDISNSNPTRASSASTITVPGGSDSEDIPVETTVGDAATATFTGSLGRREDDALLTMATTPLLVKSFTLNHSCDYLVGQSNVSVGTITLTKPAPSDTVVAVNSTNTSVATLPSAGVTVPTGQTSVPLVASFLSAGSTNFTASLNELTRQAIQTVRGPGDPVNLSFLSFNPPGVFAGESSTGTVHLDCAAPAGGALVSLASNQPNVTVPASVNIPQGQESATFTASSQPNVFQSATITATLGESQVQQTLFVGD